VAVGVVTATEPVLTAMVAAVGAAVAIELIRARGRTSGDVALAILFYGGIAGGVVIISQAPGGTPANLNSYLFGAITTTTMQDVVVFGVLAAVVLVVTQGFSRLLFAVSVDEGHARSSGLPVLAANLTLAVVTAVTVVISMRVVGLLLVSAMMIVPVATAQLIARSFSGTVIIATAISVAAALGGVTTSFSANTPSGGTIVLITIGLFALVSAGSALRDRLRTARSDAGRAQPDEVEAVVGGLEPPVVGDLGEARDQ
jgi:zinc transport system permease protein